MWPCARKRAREPGVDCMDAWALHAWARRRVDMSQACTSLESQIALMAARCEASVDTARADAAAVLQVLEQNSRAARAALRQRASKVQRAVYDDAAFCFQKQAAELTQLARAATRAGSTVLLPAYAFEWVGQPHAQLAAWESPACAGALFALRAQPIRSVDMVVTRALAGKYVLGANVMEVYVDHDWVRASDFAVSETCCNLPRSAEPPAYTFSVAQSARPRTFVICMHAARYYSQYLCVHVHVDDVLVWTELLHPSAQDQLTLQCAEDVFRGTAPRFPVATDGFMRLQVQYAAPGTGQAVAFTGYAVYRSDVFTREFERRGELRGATATSPRRVECTRTGSFVFLADGQVLLLDSCTNTHVLDVPAAARACAVHEHWIAVAHGECTSVFDEADLRAPRFELRSPHAVVDVSFFPTGELCVLREGGRVSAHTLLLPVRDVEWQVEGAPFRCIPFASGTVIYIDAISTGRFRGRAIGGGPVRPMPFCLENGLPFVWSASTGSPTALQLEPCTDVTLSFGPFHCK